MPQPNPTSRSSSVAGQRAADVPYARLARLMAIEGGFQSAMAQLTSDVLLTGFALALGAGPVHIGLLAALPLGLRLSQLATSGYFEHLGRWRAVALAGGAAGRLALLAALIAPFFSSSDAGLWILIGVVALSAVGGSLYDLAIVAWMADLIPLRLRGDFFGRRNRAIAAVGAIVTLAAALVIDSLQSRGPETISGFTAIFIIGAMIGLAGLLVLSRAPGSPAHGSAKHIPSLRLWMQEAIADRSFYRLVRFGLIWGFAVNFASPFFAVFQMTVLALPFTAITIFKAVTTLATMASSRYWGRMVDHFGAKPVVRTGTYFIAIVPLLWLATSPDRVWPLVAIQIVSGVAFAAYEGNINNLVLKLASPDRWSRALASFGAAFGAGSVIAPIVGGLFLSFIRQQHLSDLHAFFVLFVLGTVLRLVAAGQLRGVREPGGVSVGRMIRVMGRFRAMTVEFPFEPFLHYVYLPTARVADYIAPEPTPDRPRQGNEERRVDGPSTADRRNGRS